MFILSGSINYRFYLPGDEDQIVNLLKKSFYKWKRINSAIDNWKWKYLYSPVKPIVIVCIDEDKIVGVVHSILIRIKIGDSILLCAYDDDGAVSKEYRGKGIYKNIRKMMKEYEVKNGIDYRYFATENPIISNFEIKEGFKAFPFFLSHMVRVKNIEKFLKKHQKNNFIMNLGVRGMIGFNKIRNVLKSGHVKSNDFSIVEVTEFDDRIDALWEKVKSDFDYIIEKKVDYLNWKLKRPTRKHKAKIAVQEDEIIGFIILNILENEEYKEGTISDLLVIKDRIDVADSLLENACDYFDENNVDAVYYAATRDHPYQKLAMKQGFIDASLEKNTLFYYKSSDPELSELVNNSSPARVQLNFF